ncbi:MAG: hypothetical protein ACJ8AI_33020, partial [Rhodopila sp.]
ARLSDLSRIVGHEFLSLLEAVQMFCCTAQWKHTGSSPHPKPVYPSSSHAVPRRRMETREQRFPPDFTV